MKVFGLRSGAATFLLLLPLASAAVAAAEVPTLGSFLDTGQLGQVRPHGQTHRYRKPFLHPLGPESLRTAKHDATILAPSVASSPSGVVASTIVTGFDGVDEASSGAIPPDGALAVSATYIVEAVNDNLSVWTKTYSPAGDLSAVTPVIAAADLTLFFGNNPNCYTPANDFFGVLSDPSLDYDVTKDRFVLTMISFDQLFFTSSLCVAVSTTGNPADSWFIYAFPISPFMALLDFPRGVIGADGLFYVTGNLFQCCDASGNPVFSRARAYAFKSSDMYAGANTNPRVANVGRDPQTRLPADSLTPVRAIGTSGMYFLSASNGPNGGSLVTLWRWNNPFGTNKFSQQGSVQVSSYAQPPAAIQLGAFPAGVTDCAQTGANCIETNDARNLSAYWFNNTVWGAHAIGCMQAGTPVACVQWYQLGNLSGRPTLLQQGTVDDGSPGHYRYFPSLAADQAGNVALAYNYSSAADFPGIRYTPISGGVQGPETVLKAGEVTLLEPRYGDYAATTLDPHDHLTIWHTGEYAKLLSGTFSEWGTWLSAITIGP